jgi:glycosyltransferase involved in cell wall biosynthesis
MGARAAPVAAPVMKRALIATLFNEADNVSRWWDCLMLQTVLPDEIVIVDGGSKDGTWEILQTLARQSPVPVQLKQHPCNIAAGRNLAIQMTDAPIIATSDAGSFPAPDWIQEITRPLLENPAIDIVGGKNVPLLENDFQKYVTQIEAAPAEPQEGEMNGSARNTAYRRTTWADVGGYPEWLTLTGEDALFNFQLFRIGKRFSYNPRAVVRWEIRKNAAAYLKMLHSYGYGSAEAQLDPAYFRRRMLMALLPPLLLLSRHRCHFFGFRYRKNAASARGWLAGRLKGHRPPAGWKKVAGVLLSPESQKYLARVDSTQLSR